MPKKKSKDTQAQQSRRFVETAKAIEVDESGKSFDKAISAIATTHIATPVILDNSRKKSCVSKK